jgi:hypothetical protein
MGCETGVLVSTLSAPRVLIPKVGAVGGGLSGGSTRGGPVGVVRFS